MNDVNPVLAFIIGLAIILLASILNAAGLNLTKLDHVQTSAIPKSARKKDYMRPLWLLGMLLYILSQLIGSTLALEYMRAEYVAPLGSTSLVFNFLFARFLVGTPVTSTDIYGTVVVILGVIGIVAFGSINSGLTSKTDVEHLTYLWRRGGWLGYFFTFSVAVIAVLIFTFRLDAVLAARADLANPSASPSPSLTPPVTSKNTRSPSFWFRVKLTIVTIRSAWNALLRWVTAILEGWTAPKDDKQVAWTLGIGWSCCGGALAGGCLVFAKATVKLLSGSLSKQNPGNQFGHLAPIFTIILLALTAVMQIICLNRGLKVYDSTLVVPVFYGVYTATGFLNSLVFNDEVDAYQSWTLFLIFVSILVLISGVVLLTHKKPEPHAAKTPALPGINQKSAARKSNKSTKTGNKTSASEDGDEDNERDVLWVVGPDDVGDDIELGKIEDGDGDEDVDHHQHPIHKDTRGIPSHDSNKGKGKSTARKAQGEEGTGLIMDDDEDEEDNRLHHHTQPQYQSSSSSSSVARSASTSTSRLQLENPFRDNLTSLESQAVQEEFGDWKHATQVTTK